MAAVDDGAGTGAGTGTQAAGGAGQAPSGPHGLHTVELVGPHLRATGHMALGRFPRLADLVNHNRGFIVLHDARDIFACGGGIHCITQQEPRSGVA